MPPNTSPENVVIVTIYKYFEVESERKAPVYTWEEHCQITEICVFSMYSYVNRLYFSILHCGVYNVF